MSHYFAEKMFQKVSVSAYLDKKAWQFNVYAISDDVNDIDLQGILNIQTFKFNDFEPTYVEEIDIGGYSEWPQLKSFKPI